MQASPFWKRVMRVTGILCFVTLMTPPAYFFKYLIFDRPGEEAVASTPIANVSALPVSFQYTELFRDRAATSPEPTDRIAAIKWLSALVLSSDAMLSHPTECHYAESTLAGVADNDKDASVRDAANQALVDIASKGAVIKR
jgi:hypothetical protein